MAERRKSFHSWVMKSLRSVTIDLQVSGRDRKFALTSEDLLVALTDQGIRVKKPPFYAN